MSALHLSAPAFFPLRYILLLILFGVIAYAPTLRVGFMLDDPFLLRNPSIQGWTTKNLQHDFSSNVHNEKGSVYFRPMLSLMIRTQYSLFGHHSAGYHLISLVFHLFNIVLLAYLARFLLAPPLTSFIAAAFYAIHPFILDDLLAGTGGESMAIFFALLCLLLCLQKTLLSYCAGLIAAVAALLAKESNVVLPAILALALYASSQPRKTYWKVLPLVFLLFPYLYLRSTAVGNIESLTPSLLLKFFAMSFPLISLHWLKMAALPLGLESWPPVFSLSHLWVFYLALWIGLAVGVMRWGNRLIQFGFWWYIIWLLPRGIAVMQNNVMMDKWAALAAFGLWLMLASVAADRGQSHKRILRYGVPLLVVSFSVFWLTIVHWNIYLRGSDEKNYAWSVKKGNKSFAAYRLGIIQLEKGDTAEALSSLELAYQSDPSEVDYVNGLAFAYWQSNQHQKAITLLQTLLQKRPDYQPAIINLREMQRRI